MKSTDCIHLSEKYGVNPSMGLCAICNEPNGEIVLPGRLPGDTEAPREAVWHMEPCDKCKELMKGGIILFTNTPEGFRNCVLISEEALSRAITPKELLDDILKRRAANVEYAAWIALGLPTRPSEYK